MNLIDLAYKIVFDAFADKVDIAGAPYIFHLERVAAPFRDDQFLFVAALLHDLIEDCPEWSIDRLVSSGFPEQVAAVIDVLTRRPYEDYDDYILRVVDFEDARKIKLSDLRDNMNLTRLTRKLGDGDLKRIKKYHKAYLLLLR